MSTTIIHDFVPYIPPAFIPIPTEDDNGKYVGVSEGVYDLSFVDALPSVTDADNGKFLSVKNANWNKVSNPVPTPIVPKNKYAYNKIVTNDSNEFISALSCIRISIALNDGVVSIDTGRSAKTSDVLAAFPSSALSMLPSYGEVSIRYYGNPKVGTSSAYGVVNASKVEMISNSSINIYGSIPYNDANTWKAINFIINVTSDGYTVTQY